MTDPEYGTSGGVELTDELIERLATEAEEGYEVTTAYYFAARYSAHPLMRHHRDQLEAALPAAVVTSRWIDCHGGQYEQSFSQETLAADPTGCWPLGQADVEDICLANVLVAFADPTGGGKGGRHVEFGIALTIGLRLVLIGHREHVFHTHPRAELYASWAEFLEKEVERHG